MEFGEIFENSWIPPPFLTNGCDLGWMNGWMDGWMGNLANFVGYGMACQSKFI
jgi:hypothetical protein